MDGATVGVSFRRHALDGPGNSWDWLATSSLGGQDVDAYPEPFPG